MRTHCKSPSVSTTALSACGNDSGTIDDPATDLSSDRPPPGGRTSVGAHVACLLVAMAVTACATGGSSDPAEPATMDTVFAQVLEPRCTFSSCHSAPTVAAKLDLSRERACNALVGATSCLFPERKLVVPTDPDGSFLMHKITGIDLAESPPNDCSGQTNAPMPFGGSTIPQEEIDLVRSWIAAGAPCEGTDTPRPDPGPGPDVEPPPVITSLTVDRAAPLPGQIVTFTAELDKAAPAGGQLIDVQAANPSLSAPVQVFVPAGAMQVTFDAYAARPTSLFTVTARTGAISKATQLRVAGLEVTEVLTDAGHGDHSQWIKLRNMSLLPIDLSGYRLQVGPTGYGLITVPLTGTIGPGTCAVIGDPMGPLPTDGSLYYQRVDFTPDLPIPAAEATGYALFDASAPVVGSVKPPLDTVLVGVQNDDLIGIDAQLAPVGCAPPPVGSSVKRTGATTCASATPQPTQCP